MVLNFYQQNVDKCAVATFETGGLYDCCTYPFLCDHDCSLSDVAKIYAHWNLVAVPTQGSVTGQTLITEINAGRPVELGFGSCPNQPSSSGHLVLVHGWVSATRFWVHDPAQSGTGTVDYDYLLVGMGNTCWIETWTGIQP
jgi:hypothetical protein